MESQIHIYSIHEKQRLWFLYAGNTLREYGCISKVGLSTTLIPRKIFNLVENEKQFEYPLNGLIVLFECGDDTVPEKETTLNQVVKASFKHMVMLFLSWIYKSVCCVFKKLRRRLFCYKYQQTIYISFLDISYMEVKMVQKICSLYLNKINIKKKRQKAKDCFEIQATKMK